MKFPADFLWGGSVTTGRCEEARDVEKDIALFADMRVKCFRISVDLARIFPGGGEEPDEAGLYFYDEVFDFCQGYGIEIIALIDNAEGMFDEFPGHNAWEERECIDLYEKCCRMLFERYKDMVKMWLTFNGADCFHAKEPMGEQEYFQILHNKLVASARIVRYAHMHYPEFLMGNVTSFMPVHISSGEPEELLAAQEKLQMDDWFSPDIQVRGEYPYYTKRYFKEHDIKIRMDPLDINDLSEGTVDFYTLNGFDNLRWSLNEIYGRYGIPILVMEDHPDAGQLSSNIAETGKAAEDGVDLMGYIPGDLIGTGLMEWYGRVVASNGEETD